jgi:hypothetical protein
MNLRPQKFYDDGDPANAGQDTTKKVEASPEIKPGQEDKTDYKTLFEQEKEKADNAQRGFDEARRLADQRATEIDKLSKQIPPPQTVKEPPSPTAEIDARLIKNAEIIAKYKAGDSNNGFQPYDTSALEDARYALEMQKARILQEESDRQFLKGLSDFKTAHKEITDINPIAEIAVSKRISFDDALIYWNGLTSQQRADQKAQDALKIKEQSNSAKTQGGSPLPSDGQGGENATSRFYKRVYGEDLSAKVQK